MSTWWERKLGSPPPAVRENPLMPRGMGHQPREQAVDHYLQRQPQPQQQQEYPQQQGLAGLDGQHSQLINAAMNWKGDRTGALTETAGQCPHCGSNNYFSRREGAVTTDHGVVPARSECFDCGYPLRQGTLPTVDQGPVTAQQPFSFRR